MTCKDCIHFKVCDSGRHIGEHIEDDGVYSEGVERDCVAFERKQSEWISVEERLPEHLEKVLVYDEMGNMNTAMFLRYNNGNVDWCTSVRHTCQVTHWMPLPEAPKMKGDKE